MKLSEFRAIIDKLDDEAREENIEDEDIVLDIEPDEDSETKIGIGDIFKSRLSKNTVKIEPKEVVRRKSPARNVRKDRDIVIDQTNYYCPNCGGLVGKNDRFCKHCGQEMITIKEQMLEEAKERRSERRGKLRDALSKRANARKKDEPEEVEVVEVTEPEELEKPKKRGLFGRRKK